MYYPYYHWSYQSPTTPEQWGSPRPRGPQSSPPAPPPPAPPPPPGVPSTPRGMPPMHPPPPPGPPPPGPPPPAGPPPPGAPGPGECANDDPWGVPPPPPWGVPPPPPFGWPHHPFFPGRRGGRGHWNGGRHWPMPPHIPPPPKGARGGKARPAADVMDDGVRYIVEVDLPGIKKSDIELRVLESGRALCVSGALPRLDDWVTSVEGEEEETSTVIQAERPLGGGAKAFECLVRFDDPVDGEGVEARMTEGLLVVTAIKAKREEGVKVPVV